jgi:RNA polymerase sigma factor (sigma-70 family)
MTLRTNPAPGKGLALPARFRQHRRMCSMKLEAEIDGAHEGAAELLERRAALDGLFRRYSPALTRFLRRRTSNAEDAADLLQELYLRILRLADVASIRNPEAFLFRAATNVLHDRARADRARDVQEHTNYEDYAEELDSGDDPLRRLIARQDLARLRDAIEHLRPKTRHVYFLHRFENMTYAQIAAHLGLSVSGVEKHMMKAIAQIEAQFAREDGR